MNKKGDLVNNIFLIVIIAVVLFMIIVGFWGMSILMPIAVGESQTLASSIKGNINILSPNTAIANASNTAIGMAESVLGIVEIIVYLVFFGFLIGFLAVAYYVKTYKWLIFFWVAIIFGAVIVSMFLSNAYQEASNNPSDIQQFYYTWGTNHFIMTNLPMLVAFFGILTGVILFTIRTTADETEEQIL